MIAIITTLFYYSEGAVVSRYKMEYLCRILIANRGTVLILILLFPDFFLTHLKITTYQYSQAHVIGCYCLSPGTLYALGTSQPLSVTIIDFLIDINVFGEIFITQFYSGWIHKYLLHVL